MRADEREARPAPTELPCEDLPSYVERRQQQQQQAAPAVGAGEGDSGPAAAAGSRSSSDEPPSKRQRQAPAAQQPEQSAYMTAFPIGGLMGAADPALLGTRGNFVVESVSPTAIFVSLQLAGRDWKGALFCPPPSFQDTPRARGSPDAAPLLLKKPRTAFNFFSDAVRPGAKERHPHMDQKGISKVVGDMWAQLSAEDRAPYNEAAQADRERYDQEVKQHQARFPLGTRRELHRNAGPPAMLADQPPQPQHQQYAHQQHQHQHQHQQQYEGGGGTFSSHQYQSSQEPSVTAAMAAAGAGPPDRGGWSGEMSIGLSAMPPPAVGLPMPWSAKGPGGAQATRHSGMEASAASQHSPPGSATPYQTVLGQLGLLPAPQAAARRAAPVPQPGQQGGSPAEVLQALLQQLEPGRQQQGQQQAQVQAEAQQQGTTISQLLSALMPRPGQAPIGDPAAPAAAQADAPSTVQLTTEVLALLMRAQQQPPH